MKEILGYSLEKFFNTIETSSNTIIARSFKNDRYEVWEVSDRLFQVMCDMSEEEFVKLAGDDAWWRSSEGSVLGVPYTKFNVNGKKMIGWNTRGEYENFQYANLSDYLCYGVGASQPKNVCALAIDLSKYNNMTMGELFRKY